MDENRDVKLMLQGFKRDLEVTLSQYLAQKTKEAYDISEAAGEMLENISDITMRGGKRVRAALLYYSYLAHGGKDTNIAMQASMAMELAQTFLLIHDDIIDNDSLRRGSITIHKAYEKIANERYPEKVDPLHYGQSVGILAGDSACGFSNEIIAELNVDAKYVSRALLELNRMYKLEYYGQLMDVNSEIKKDITKEEVLKIHSLKTSPYTFDGPLKIGAILAGVSEEKIAALDAYTVPLGVAFQIQDDVLGTFGNEEKLGKPVTSDLREGKRTLLILDALERGDEEQRKIILKNLGNGQVGTQELEEVRSVLREIGSLERSNTLAERYVQNAKEAMSKMDLERSGKFFLLEIADYMVKREY